MKKKKQQAFDSNYDIIYLLWHLGKGLMFRIQLVNYFELLGSREKDVIRGLDELTSAGLLKQITYGNTYILQLQKFSIYTLLKKKPEEIKSISYKEVQIERAAFLNERVIQRFAARPYTKQSRGVVVEVNSLMRTMSHVAKAKRSYKILDELPQETKRIMITEHYGVTELDRLKLLEEYSRSKSDKARLQKRIEKLRTLRAVEDIGKTNKSEHGFNLNSLDSRHIYFSIEGRGAGRFSVILDFFDRKNNMRPEQLRAKLRLTYNYMRQMFNADVEIEVNVLVTGDGRESYFKSKLPTIQENFRSDTKLIADKVKINIINLGIQKRVLQNIILIG